MEGQEERTEQAAVQPQEQEEEEHHEEQQGENHEEHQEDPGDLENHNEEEEHHEGEGGGGGGVNREEAWNHFLELLRIAEINVRNISSEGDIMTVIQEMWPDASMEETKAVIDKWLEIYKESMGPVVGANKGNTKFFDIEAYDNVVANIKYPIGGLDAQEKAEKDSRKTFGINFYSRRFSVKSRALHPLPRQEDTDDDNVDSEEEEREVDYDKIRGQLKVKPPHWHTSVLRALAAMYAEDWTRVREQTIIALTTNPNCVAALIIQDISREISPKVFGRERANRAKILSVLNTMKRRRWDNYFTRLPELYSLEYPCALTLCGEYAYVYLGDFYTAARLFAAAAEKRSCHAMHRMSVMYTEGLGVTENKSVAYVYAKDALEYSLGKNLMGFFISNKYMYTKDVELSNTYFKSAADEGLNVAKNNIGFSYKQGDGTAIDAYRAYDYFNNGAKHGYTRARCQTGIMHQRGFGTEVDYVKAIDSYIESKILDSKTNISICMKDPPTFAEFMRRAHKGDAVAQILCFVFRKCCETYDGNDEEYIKLLEKGATEGGSTEAMCMLGMYYGDQDNKEKADKWLSKARSRDSLVGILLSGIYYGAGVGLKKSPLLSMAAFKRANDFIGITEVLGFSFMGVHLKLGGYCDKNPNDVDALYTLGWTLELITRHNRAYDYDTIIQVYTQALENGCEEAKAALSRFNTYVNPYIRRD